MANIDLDKRAVHINSFHISQQMRMLCLLNNRHRSGASNDMFCGEIRKYQNIMFTRVSYTVLWLNNIHFT